MIRALSTGHVFETASIRGITPPSPIPGSSLRGGFFKFKVIGTGFSVNVEGHSWGAYGGAATREDALKATEALRQEFIAALLGPAVTYQATS